MVTSYKLHFMVLHNIITMLYMYMASFVAITSIKIKYKNLSLSHTQCSKYLIQTNQKQAPSVQFLF